MRSRAALLLLALALSLSACRWREDRYVWVERYDAGPDAAPDGDACGSEEAHPINAEALLSLIASGAEGLVVVDARDETLCRALRIPGAQCLPYVEGAFTGGVEGLAEATDVVVYGQSLDPGIIEAAESLELTCDQTLLVLEDGFQGWTELDYETESDD